MNSVDSDLVDPNQFWVVCQMCSVKYTFPVDPEGYYRWQFGGVYIQDALPDNTPAERELMLNRICGTCFDQMFPPGDEE